MVCIFVNNNSGQQQNLLKKKSSKSFSVLKIKSFLLTLLFEHTCTLYSGITESLQVVLT